MKKELILDVMGVVSFFFATSFAVVFMKTQGMEQLTALGVAFLFGVIFIVINNIPRRKPN